MNIHVKPPGEAQDALYFLTDISPEVVFQAIGRLRREAQDEIDRLLSFLDETDGDGDLEPLLGAPETSHFEKAPAAVWARGSADDREDDADLESTERDDDEEGFDAEPSLGSSLDNNGYGAFYANVPLDLFSLDLEDQHDGAEPDVDGEPALGSLDRMMNQEKGWRQTELSGGDCELDDCDLEENGDLEPSFGGSADEEREQDFSDTEPSLGWTADGVVAGFDDLEDAAGPKVAEARRRKRPSLHSNVGEIVAEWKV